MASIVLVLLLLAAPTALAQSPAGAVTGLSGEASVLRGDARTPLAVGSALEAGDTVVTANGARVALELADGTRIVVGGSTEMRLPAAGDPEPSGAMRLLIGIARFAVGPSARVGGPEVVTRTAVASVRSTDWIVEAREDVTGVFVLEGEVLVADLDGLGEVVVAPGLGTNVAAGQAPTDPGPWGSARIRDVLGRTAAP